MTDPTSPSREKGLFSAVFLISVAALALQVLQMRIFAFVLWQHLAFLVISIAILGFGASGSFLSVMGFLRHRKAGNSVAVAGILFALTAFAGPLLLTEHAQVLFGKGKVAVDFFKDFDKGRVALYLVVFMLPYFFAGYVISLALIKEKAKVSKLYFVNMIGSGLGCFVLFATFEPLGAEGSLLVTAALGGGIGLLAAESKAMRILSGAVAVLLLAGLPFAARLFPFEVADSKFIASYLKDYSGLLQDPAKTPGIADHSPVRVTHSAWTTLGRLQYLQDKRFKAFGLHQGILFQDGDAPGIMPAKDDPASIKDLHAIGYEIEPKPKVLVIGIGGGLDLRYAVDLEAKDITGVEINPRTLEFFENEFRDWHGLIDRRPDMKLVAAEGRTFIRRTKEKYDLIQMSGVDTYTALSSGAYVLSESYLYTRQAFHDYLDKLTDDGMFAIIRFAFPAPRETLRIMAIAMDVLAARGDKEPWKHVAVVRTHLGQKTGLGGILVKNSAFTKAELDKLRAWSANAGCEDSYLPDEELDNPFHALAQAVKAGKVEEFYASYPYNIRPVVDDKPFFFNQFGPGAVWDYLTRSASEKPKETGIVWVALRKDFQTKPVGMLLLTTTAGLLLILVLICIFLPLLFVRGKRAGQGTRWAPIGYFLCLGFAYIFLMISSMQRFSLLLGHPTYAISVTMATFLVVSGLGSLVSGRFAEKRAPLVLALVALFLCAWFVFLQIQLPTLTALWLPKSFAMRALLTIGLISPMAFAMGMCFPTGMRQIEHREAMIPWAYGVNGAASVLGSVLSVGLAMVFGFTNVQWFAAALYILAALLMRRLVRERRAGSDQPPADVVAQLDALLP